MHFARSIVLGYHSIPKIKWGSFRGRREEKWGSFRGRFGDHFRVGDHFGVGIISGAVHSSERVRYFSTREEKFCISKWPCNVLFIKAPMKCQTISLKYFWLCKA